ncbi:hypothetical protein DUNSADRAFT_1582 [Dunaliella salina]|uniref:Secreted protein n=1 Tax=Dunaliella salina TaxID=3046 RepID=A0ABQ7H8L7_DUNSA|nr:hypothetical protein DUNSADRAFT_1582 [Dunaliella salina]|eukprot:KAF5843155.1 hypothetical protein DUNSADRAFT_1582 [Dunaliella salina]
MKRVLGVRSPTLMSFTCACFSLSLPAAPHKPLWLQSAQICQHKFAEAVHFALQTQNRRASSLFSFLRPKLANTWLWCISGKLAGCWCLSWLPRSPSCAASPSHLSFQTCGHGAYRDRLCTA